MNDRLWNVFSRRGRTCRIESGESRGPDGRAQAEEEKSGSKEDRPCNGLDCCYCRYVSSGGEQHQDIVGSVVGNGPGESASPRPEVSFYLAAYE